MGASTSSSVRPGPDPPPAVASTPPTSKHVQPGAGAPPTGAGSRGGSSLSPLCTSDPSRPANTGGRKGSHSRSMTASESVRGSDSIQQDSLSVEQVPRRPSKSLSPVQLGNGGHILQPRRGSQDLRSVAPAPQEPRTEALSAEQGTQRLNRSSTRSPVEAAQASPANTREEADKSREALAEGMWRKMIAHAVDSPPPTERSTPAEPMRVRPATDQNQLPPLRQQGHQQAAVAVTGVAPARKRRGSTGGMEDASAVRRANPPPDASATRLAATVALADDRRGGEGAAGGGGPAERPTTEQTAGAKRRGRSSSLPYIGESPLALDRWPAPGVALVQRTSESLTVSWEEDPELEKALAGLKRPEAKPRYELQVKAEPGPADASVRADSPPPLERGALEWRTVVAATVARTYFVNNLQPDTRYVFRVRRGKGAFGPVSEGMRTAPSVPGAPPAPVAAEISAQSILVQWQGPHITNGLPVLSYVLECKTFTGQFSVSYSGPELLHLVSGLKPSTIYVFRVAAVNRVGQGEFGACTAVRTVREAAAAAPSRWLELVDYTPPHHRYFYHPKTRQSSWELPAGAEVDAEESFRRRRAQFLEALKASTEAVADPLAAGPVDSPYVKIEVVRSDLLESAYRAFMTAPIVDLIKKPLRVKYVGEDGIDAGGIVKDFFLAISRSLMDERVGLLCRVGETKSSTFGVEPRALQIHASACQYYRFLGRVMAKALIDRHSLTLYLERGVLLFLLGIRPTMDDLGASDPAMRTSLQWIQNNDITGVIFETFSVTFELFGETQQVELTPGGAGVEVTEGNKGQYVQLMLDWLMRRRVERQLEALRQGFREMVPHEALYMLGPEELQRLLVGSERIDVSEIRATAVYGGGYAEGSQQIVWFWQYLEAASAEGKQGVLSFVTGSTKVPLDGFDPPFQIVRPSEGPKAYPRSHTCFNQLALPPYESFEVLSSKMSEAVRHAQEGFHMT